MPISTLISLIPETDVNLRPTMGHHAHAAFLSIMRETNPKVAKELHASSAQKPFTVSPLIAEGKRRGDFLYIRAGTDCKLRFTFLDDTLFTFFGQSFLTQTFPTIRLGDAIFSVKQLVSHTSEDQNWSGSATYPDLIQTAKTDYKMSFRFYSPTAFRRLTARGEKTRDDASIDMERCYQSWVNKWNAFAPINLDKNEILSFVREYGQVTRVDTRSKRLNYGKHTVPGWVGSCSWVFYPDKSIDENLLRIVNCLANFAFYCGTGYKTTMGMGQTQRAE
ncbi:CRISPR-associated endoribonuclease Cas6 [Candidatus Poribacteria bacterium]|nr:CRISPR-associated endoribonuclease Cas6 [Candidatus Poribacteria bacterium]